MYVAKATQIHSTILKRAHTHKHTQPHNTQHASTPPCCCFDPPQSTWPKLHGVIPQYSSAHTHTSNPTTHSSHAYSQVAALTLHNVHGQSYTESFHNTQAHTHTHTHTHKHTQSHNTLHVCILTCFCFDPPQSTWPKLHGVIPQYSSAHTHTHTQTSTHM